MFTVFFAYMCKQRKLHDDNVLPNYFQLLSNDPHKTHAQEHFIDNIGFF